MVPVRIQFGDPGFTLLDPGIIGSIAGALIGAAATLAGLIYASRELREAARRYNEEAEWRQADFLNGLVAQIHCDKNIALIFRVLDWREGPAVVPPDFLPIFAGKQVFEMKWDRFIASLEVHRTGKEWVKPDMYTYRSCFDSYCSFIQRISEDKRIEKLGYYQFADIKFFCERTVDPLNQFKKADSHARQKIKDFIVHYYGAHTYKTIDGFAKAVKTAPDAESGVSGIDIPDGKHGAAGASATGSAPPGAHSWQPGRQFGKWLSAMKTRVRIRGSSSNAARSGA